MWRDRRFHSKRLPGWARNVQLTLSAFSKWCNIITWGNVLSSKWDKFIFCRAAFVPSGGEAIKLQDQWGAQLGTCGMNEEPSAKRLGHRPNLCLCLLCGPGLRKQEATLLWNKFPLIWACWSGGSGGKAALLRLPRLSHTSAQFTLANTPHDGRHVGGGEAIGVEGVLELSGSQRFCGPLMCALSRPSLCPGESIWAERSWHGTGQLPPVSSQPTLIQLVFFESQSTYHL